MTTDADSPRPAPPEAAPSAPANLEDYLEAPWRGLRPDLKLFPGPLEYDGQRSWVLEDPVRGNTYRLGHAEGELVYRLTTGRDLESAVRHLYQTTTLRPSAAEVVAFLTMLQRERLARLPADYAERSAAGGGDLGPPSLLEQLRRGSIFFRIPLLRPDAFLHRTVRWAAMLWSPPLRWFYLLCGLTGLALTMQEIETYLGTVNYLFTPQGGLAFLACLVLLKIGHEFAHAYAAKAMGLHVRSMGIMLIVVWPLLYTDTTDAWKLPDRRRRTRISAAGVLFELTVAGIALLLWAGVPDGIARSIFFFLSGTSLVSTVLINLNPFMRYDGYYLLMDLWGIDNLRPRAFAMLRHGVRRLLLDWKAPSPEIHPHRRAMLVYGFFAALYRLFIGATIAIAVYFLLFPALGLAVFLLQLWLFMVRPLVGELRAAWRGRRHWGSRLRIAASSAAFAALLTLLVLPLPRFESIPSLLLFKEAIRVKSPAAGRLADVLPAEGRTVTEGETLVRLQSETLAFERRQSEFDLEKVRASIRNLGTSPEQVAYGQWLAAEAERLQSILDQYREAMAQLEIRAPADGRVVDVNSDLYAGAFLPRGAHLFTVMTPGRQEVKAFVHEKAMPDLRDLPIQAATIRLPAPEIPAIRARLVERSRFPVSRLPNQSLFDIAGGPIVSMEDSLGRRPRDAFFTLTFEVETPPPGRLAHGLPSRLWLRTAGRPLLVRAAAGIWQPLSERGFF
ncbi:MAG: HlyD family efflux transporter periplasmic adaptor subunit [Desulfococcaceae bacterium]